jgi:hypothetical protein
MGRGQSSTRNKDSRRCFLRSQTEMRVRQACSLKTKFPTQHQASRYLRQNWHRIEQMARDCLARELECFEDGRINLVMI